MQVLVATTIESTNEQRAAIDGELVTPVVLECGDAECGRCARSWVGLVSDGGSVAAVVVDRPGVTEADLRRAVHDWLDRSGWIDLVVQASEAGEYEVDGIVVDDPVRAVCELVDDHVAAIGRVCAAFTPGTVVSRLGELVSASANLYAA